MFSNTVLHACHPLTLEKTKYISIDYFTVVTRVTKDTNDTMNRSALKANTCNYVSQETWENKSEQFAVGFGRESSASFFLLNKTQTKHQNIPKNMTIAFNT